VIDEIQEVPLVLTAMKNLQEEKPELAVKWYRMAADNESEEARDALKRLGAELDREK
jgi:TPR repeat protein